jgi:hypothetical protein
MGCNACFAPGTHVTAQNGEKLSRSFVDLPQPRYIGPRYRTSSPRIAWVMINPGAGKAKATDREKRRDSKLRYALETYRRGGMPLQAVFDVQREQLRSWGSMLSFIEHHGLDVDELALINVAISAFRKN